MLETIRACRGAGGSFGQIAVDGELLEPRVLRLDHAEAFAHARLGQLARHGEQAIGRVVGAEIGHLRKFLFRHGARGIDRGRAVVCHEMLRQQCGEGLDLGLFDLRDGDEGDAAEGL